MAATYGFRIVGGLTGQRRLIVHRRALAGYCHCDEAARVEVEGYLSAFAYTAEFRDHLDSTGSTRDYAGHCCASWLWFDLDQGDDLDAALTAARRLSAAILDRYRAKDDDDLLCFFSGNKGFHVGVPLPWEPPPSTTFHRVCRRFAERLADLAGVRIDAGVYDLVRAFRAPNSRHPRSGLHKRRLTHDELMGLSIERVVDLARHPHPFDLPTPSLVDPVAVTDWKTAEADVRQQTVARAERRIATASDPKLNRATVEFIRDGAAEGDRHRLLFSAAANLAEFDCPPALAHALLTEPALDSGLPPGEVRRQVECGLRHGRRPSGATVEDQPR